MANVPTLRFPGFTGEWETLMLSEIAPNISAGRSGNPIENGDFYLYGSTGIIGKTNNAQYQGEKILIARVGANAGKISYNNETCGITDNTLIVKSAKISARYLYYYLTRYNLNRLIFGSGQPLITGGMLKKIPISFPELIERNKIISFLSLLDERIALQSKLIEDLKKLKSAIVERMLQQETESTVILSSLGRFIRGVTYSTEDITDGDGTLVMRATNITTGSPLNFKSDVVTISKRVSKEQLIATNDIVICLANGSSALIGKNSVYDGGSLSSLTIGAFCGVFRPNHSFVKWLFQTSQYRTNVARSIQGGNGAIANLSPSDILTMKFALPNDDVLNMDDNLLNMIDDKLVTETKLLDDILNQKCYLLSAMFI